MSATQKENAPKDRYYFVCFLFLILGLVHMLPWSFFTTATEIWMYKFRNTTLNETNPKDRTELQAQFTSVFNICLQVTEVVFLFVGLFLDPIIDVKTRLIGIHCIILSFFIILAAFIKINTDSWQLGFFVLVMICACGINSANAVFTMTLYTTVSYFPQAYLGYYLTGCGMSKLFTSVLQILTLATGLSTQDSAIMYFLLGIFFILFSLTVLIFTIKYNQYFRHTMIDYNKKNHQRTTISLKEAWSIFKKTWSPIVMMGSYYLSYDVSPWALVVSENVKSGPWNDIYFIPVVTFFLTALGEVIGRLVGYKLVFNFGSKTWAFLTLLKTAIFVPLYIFSNAQPRDHLPVLLPHDYQYIIIVITNNLVCGYLLTRAAYNIKGLVTEEELKHAYHVNMLCGSFELVGSSFLGSLMVELL